MRILRRAALLACITAVAMATIGSAQASAQSIEVTRESTGLHCAVVTLTAHVVSGGCPMSFTANNLSLENVITIDTCNLSVEARVDEDGAGHIYNQTFSGADCDSTPCVETGGAKRPWAFNFQETAAGSTKRFNVNICVVTDLGFPLGNSTTQCDLHIPVTTMGHNQMVLDATPGVTCEGGTRSVFGDFFMGVGGAHPPVELIHV